MSTEASPQPAVSASPGEKPPGPAPPSRTAILRDTMKLESLLKKKQFFLAARFLQGLPPNRRTTEQVKILTSELLRANQTESLFYLLDTLHAQGTPITPGIQAKILHSAQTNTTLALHLAKLFQTKYQTEKSVDEEVSNAFVAVFASAPIPEKVEQTLRQMAKLRFTTDRFAIAQIVKMLAKQKDFARIGLLLQILRTVDSRADPSSPTTPAETSTTRNEGSNDARRKAWFRVPAGRLLGALQAIVPATDLEAVLQTISTQFADEKREAVLSIVSNLYLGLVEDLKEKSDLAGTADLVAGLRRHNIKNISIRTYNQLMHIYANADNVPGAYAVLDMVRADSPPISAGTLLPLVEMHMRLGQFTDAKQVWALFQRFKLTPDFVSWNAVMARFASRDDVENTESCLVDMVASGYTPDSLTYTVLMKLYRRVQDTPAVKRLVEGFARRQFRLDSRGTLVFASCCDELGLLNEVVTVYEAALPATVLPTLVIRAVDAAQRLGMHQKAKQIADEYTARHHGKVSVAVLRKFASIDTAPPPTSTATTQAADSVDSVQ